MCSQLSDAEPQAHEELITSALKAIVGSRPIHGRVRVSGGASGATLLRVDAGELHLLVRLEGRPSPFLQRSPHRFAAMTIAAEVGVAPRVHYIDEDVGLTITDFIVHKSLAEFPGGSISLAQKLGELLRRLQSHAQFPLLLDFRDLLRGTVGQLANAGICTVGLLDPYAAALERHIDRLDWDRDGAVASHNDPHPNNILFDGERLWLIDWEAAYGNHPMVDVAIVSEAFASERVHEEALLTAWLGEPPTRQLHERFQAVRRLARLYYGCFLLQAGSEGEAEPVNDLGPLTPTELRAQLMDGRLQRGSRRTALEFGKIYLDSFLTGAPPRDIREAVEAAF
jgi:aminoglycoside phosphotransferase (APT) family kinase protein